MAQTCFQILYSDWYSSTAHPCPADEQRRIRAAHLYIFLEYKTWKRAIKGGLSQRIGYHIKLKVESRIGSQSARAAWLAADIFVTIKNPEPFIICKTNMLVIWIGGRGSNENQLAVRA